MLLQRSRFPAADSSDKLHPRLAAVEARYFVTSEMATGRSEDDHPSLKKTPLRLLSGDFQRLSGSQKLVEKGS